MPKLVNKSDKKFRKKINRMYTMFLGLDEEFERYKLYSSKRHLSAAYKSFERDVISAIKNDATNKN